MNIFFLGFLLRTKEAVGNISRKNGTRKELFASAARA